MVSRFRSWWQQIKQRRVAIGVVGVVLLVVIALIIAGYRFDWTSFNEYNQVTIAHTTSGPSAGTVVRTEVYQPGKNLWDWLQLLGVLAIPVVVGFGAAWFAAQQGKVSDRENTDNQRETALQAYIDSMSELLLEKKLRESGKDDEVRKIARVRTLTVLPRLDGGRKKSALQFLHESGLINQGMSVIDLTGADLSKADLRGAILFEANLRGAILIEADLRGANLIRAHLRGAILIDANLLQADLSQADLSRADLSRAILGKANLSFANLSGAYLDLADLLGANLMSATVTGDQLHKAKSLARALMPDGNQHA